MMKTLVFVAAAAMGLTACQNDFEEQIEAKDAVVVTFVADSADSRTSVDTSGDKPAFAWAETGETFAVLEQTDALAEATAVAYEKEESKAKITATFDNNTGKESYQYVTIYPASGYVSAENIEAATLTLPAEQTMAEGSYDPDADLMVSKVVTTTAQPTEAQMVQFTRLAAVAKMSFNGLGSQTVESVTFTAEGKTLAGKVTANLSDPHAFEAQEGGSNTVTVTAPEGGVEEVYFTLLPTTLEAGDSYSITVITDSKIYKKTAAIPEGKSLEFAAGMVTRFGVDLTTATVSDKWVLVRDVNDLEAGDIVTFVTNDLNWAMGKPGSYYHYASYTEVVKMGDYFFHPIAAESESNSRVQQLVVAPRPGKENAFDFYNRAGEYNDDNYSGYIRPHSTNNYIKYETTPNHNTLFYTTIDENGVATLEATDSEYDYIKLVYRAYSGGGTTGNRRFGCTKTLTNEHHDICIYKIAGGVKGVVPVAKANITVPDEEEPVVVAKEGVAVATAIDAVTFGYVGNWTINVSDNADWLEVYYANEQLTYTATANEGEVRNATVTITATHDGESDIVETFNVVQKGAPKNASIKDFSGYGIDENTEYLVTGVITTRVTSTSSNTVLSDVNSNTANFRYIYMEDGSSFYNNAANTLGNVVTILASKSYSASYGGSSSAHAICQGYYNISASADKDFVEYGGGSVDITIEKTGTLQPGTINGSVDGNFAELTANGDKYVLTLNANDGAPRQVVATFTDGYDTTSVTVVQAADTSKGNTWELVTDASTLAAGDKVIIAAKDYDVAMSTSITSSKRSAVAVTKLGNKFITPVVGTQTFVLGAGSVDGTFVFYDDTNKGFLVSSNTSAELINQAYTDENTSFAISIEDGVATIANTAGDFSSNKLSYYYSSATSNYFCSSNSTSTTYKPLCLYRLVGVQGTIPVVAADFTVEDAAISAAAAPTPTAIPEVVFNYVGDWTITATSEDEWITSLNYDKTNNCLTYTAEANESTFRETTVTITATHANAESITKEFTLLQKGYTPVMTIAEYLAIPAEDRNDSKYVRYQLTGRIESIESVSAENSKFIMTDGTEEVQVYGLITEDGEKDYGDFGLKVGDVVTITAPRLTSTVSGVETAGKGSTNPAYYLSHYNIAATATAAEYVAGSTATISVTTTSGLDVTYEMEACDFATIDYSADSSQENTTAVVTFNSENTAEQARSVDVTFRTGMASTTITVTQKIDPAKVKGWVLVTDASELAVGDEVIIVAKNYDVAMGCFTSSSTSTANKNKSDVEIVGNAITTEEVETKSVQKYTLVEGYVENSFAFEFTYNNSTYYLYASSSGLVLNSSKSSALRAYKIEIDADGKAAIKSQGSTTYVVTYNYKTTTPIFTASKTSAALATDSEAGVCIYKNTEKE